MNWQKIVSGFILGGLGVIFTFDFIAFVFGNETISEQITEWGTKNPSVFWGAVVLIVVHFWRGKYEKD